MEMCSSLLSVIGSITVTRPASAAASFLAAKAAVAWLHEEGPEYRDDITVIVIYLEQMQRQVAEWSATVR